MIDALYIAASGLQGEQTQIDTISNNMANMQTPGFKRSRVSFQNIAAITPQEVAAGQQALSAGEGTETLPVHADFTDGTLKQTSNPLDLAVQGKGFFEVTTEAGDRLYTRDGQFHVDAQGYLVTAGGNRLSSDLQIPPDAKDVKIDTNGRVMATLGTDTEPTELGQIELAVFPSDSGLQPVGNNAFMPTADSGEPSIGRPNQSGFGTVHQGMVEQANVDMVHEMTSLVLAQRAYQLNARVLQAADQILDTINNLRR
ncbi:flagellar basal-body rod protein FlgG [Oleiagrimonas citrea]|uniref:Flagellar basal-body rod protein FlgG n=1 Tax=Oleiagrimonas citrea TaxID=1665687 RepID=A0A846ZL23_9GAMM|nr:flagellar basal-body rod protein FlgG [Oleiagrimonas citrea]NKZ39015.1 flagellar basal-body rod protein FlgG [Oleiagrimonas citrea]